ncbi:hypothetical protein B4U80_14074 [Leptotrombidium deliense]|uniref:Serpin domain-containing protein n=1 Tax=Leptotrombidium deliense TaxID=299467 RepID=A0A443S3A4_9ACAR|nr:hypothetical protein B4U80_14074 [Leptotrombidium deliense]
MSDCEALSISSLKTMTTFEVNEQGIRFTSLTKIEQTIVRYRKPKPEFFCNRPFLFFVLSKNENLQLLIGLIERILPDLRNRNNLSNK